MSFLKGKKKQNQKFLLYATKNYYSLKIYNI